MLRKKTKIGATYIFDAAVALILLNTIIAIFHSSIAFHNKSVMTAEQNFYEEQLLTECAEVVHSVRYGEWDVLGENGWESFQTKYPTGMYVLAYNNTTHTFELNKLMHAGTHVLSPEDAQAIGVVDNFEKIYYQTQTNDWALANIGENDYALRAVFINNTASNLSDVRCMVKTNKFGGNDRQINNYRDLKFIMMNYI